MYAFFSLLELHTYVTLYDLVTAGTILRQRKEIPQLRVEEILQSQTYRSYFSLIELYCNHPVAHVCSSCYFRFKDPYKKYNKDL